MKTIAVISSQYFWLPEESGPTRFFSIAKTFQDAGYGVDVVTSSFEHHEKRQRDKKLESPFHIIYIDCTSYKKNVGVLREFSNIVFTEKIRCFLKSSQRYDAIYCSVPPNNIGAAVGRYCYENQIPFIVDVEDLWPEAMSMIIKNRIVSSAVFRKYLTDAEKTYRYADAVVGTSEEYSLRAMKNNERNIPYRTIYVGNDIDRFDEGVRQYSPEIKKNENDLWITYAGSLGVSYDILTLIRCAQDMSDRYPYVTFQILGSGPRYEEFLEVSKERSCNVHFWGYVKYEKMAAVLEKSDILINSVVKNSSAGIINKIGDYLAAKKPMINTGSNKEFRKKVESGGFGFNVEAENTSELKNAIEILIADRDLRIEMGRKARYIAETQFDRKKTYQHILELAESVMNQKGGKI